MTPLLLKNIFLKKFLKISLTPGFEFYGLGFESHLSRFDFALENFFPRQNQIDSVGFEPETIKNSNPGVREIF